MENCVILRVYLFIFCIFATTACVDSASARKDNVGSGTTNQTTENPANTSPQWVDEVVPEVELTHFIDPLDGSYSRKLTLPRNFDGHLFLAGLNLATLADKALKVRFTFGKEKTPVMLTATVGKGQGATANTIVDVLMVDLQGQNQLYSVQLFYDLFDYNQYDFDTIAAGGGDVAQSNRDPGLYCRGLLLDDDPTFTGSTCNASSTGPEGACLYSYASIKDKGLEKEFTTGSYVYTVPSEPHISAQVNAPYYQNTDSIMTKRCLQDFTPTATLNWLTPPNYVYSSLETFNSFDDIINIAGTNYRYSGPYRAVNIAQWALPAGVDSALFGRYGIFRKSLRDGLALSEKIRGGVVSNLFPRYTKKNISSNVEHLATSLATTPGEEKSIQNLASSGKSNWMDGCNARVTSWSQVTGEHIGSCNVTGKVEVLYYDFQLNKNILLLESKKLKLQLVRPAVINSNGEDVLASTFSYCSSNTQCGSDSCCFNNRCWSKDIISQCLDETSNTGGYPSGAACSSDLQCASLCCDQTSGVCNVHQNSNEQNPVLCNKNPGQACIAQDWCAKQIVPECYVVDTGPGADGCMYQCFNVERSGNCTNNYCVTPTPRPSDPWNPSDPNRCANERQPGAVPLPFD